MLQRLWTDDDHRKMLATGQLSMVASLAVLWTGAFFHFRGITPLFPFAFASQSFWAGFCIGLGITLGLFSIVMNVRGLVALRRIRRRDG